MKLKIKVFIKKEKRIEEVSIVNFKKRTVKLNEGIFNGSYKFNDVLFLHYTGLQDIKFNDVYEGDILLINDTEEMFIIFDKTKGMFLLKSLDGLEQKEFTYLQNKKLQIINNIFIRRNDANSNKNT